MVTKTLADEIWYVTDTKFLQFTAFLDLYPYPLPTTRNNQSNFPIWLRKSLVISGRHNCRAYCSLHTIYASLSYLELVSAVCVLRLDHLHPPFGDVLSPLVWMIVPCPTDPTMKTKKKSIFVSLNFSNASPGPFVNGVELKNVGRPFFSFRYDSTVTILSQILLPRYASRPADQCPAYARPLAARLQHASMILDHEVSLVSKLHPASPCSTCRSFSAATAASFQWIEFLRG